MKKIRVLALCLTLVALLVVGLVACTDSNGDESGTSTEAPKTESATETATDPATEQATETETGSAADSETVTESDGSSSEAESSADFSGDEYIKISSAEDLMAFAKSINRNLHDDTYDSDWLGIEEKTVVFLADIDLAGLEWEPLDGSMLYCVTFDGQGHSVKNMTINYNTDRSISDDAFRGSGFIGTLPADESNEIIFKDITFEDAKVVARERHVGCLVGRSMGTTCTFENVTVKGFTVDGWCDNNNTSADTDGYPIAFRVAGIMGATWGGDHTFKNVTVQNLNISGFHNLAGILGYDASGRVSEYSFENCKVENATMVFSYCLSDAYTVDMPRKFVSVFFNGAGWVDNIDACVEMGNTYSGVSFYDWTSTEEVDEFGNKKVSSMTEYTPDNFRSWTQEEKDAAA